MEPLDTLFLHARELVDPAQRAAYLTQACGGDAELRQRVEAMLRDAAGAEEYFGPGKANRPTIAPAPPPEGPGTWIGRYKLLERIGEGGMGVVYMAEQREPVLRKVALKIIKAGMDTRQVVARFEAERQALALMDHPNIAKVWDGDATDSGRPYFVMELVEGVAITQFCDQNELTIGDRLQLFINVCQAVQHAHQKGIIHRDLKPSNVLVTMDNGVAHPMVIDFGVAKAIDQNLTEKTFFTNFGTLIGTPAYMSPEQAEMSKLDVDTRADIYSLGVLLYELLTGTTPFAEERLRSVAYGEMQRILQEEEPERPSTRLRKKAIAKSEIQNPTCRAEAQRRRESKIDSDLDWIVMKCLEKDRTRRYETANGLGADLQRHLSNEPIVARPPSAGYRIQKLIRRNRLAFAAAAAVTLALVFGFGVSTWLYLKERVARQRAHAAETKAQNEAIRSAQAAQFMQGMLSGLETGKSLGRDTTLLREMLDNAGDRVSRELKNQPEVESEMRRTIGHAYYQLGEHLKAEAMLREALALQKHDGNPASLELADLQHLLALALRHQGKQPEAEALHREALAIQRRLLPREDLCLPLAQLGSVLRDQGKYGEAESCFREALAIYEKLGSKEHRDLAWALNSLALNLHGQGKFAEAEDASKRALAMRTKLFGNDHPHLALSINTLALALGSQGKLAEAEALHRKAWVMLKKFLPPDHPDMTVLVADLGRSLTEWAWAEPSAVADQCHEAEGLLRELWFRLLRNPNAPAWRTAEVMGRLGDAVAVVAVTDSSLGADARSARFIEAEKLLLEANEVLQSKPAETKYKRDALNRLVRLYEVWNTSAPDLGKSSSAREWIRKREVFEEAMARR